MTECLLSPVREAVRITQEELQEATRRATRRLKWLLASTVAEAASEAVLRELYAGTASDKIQVRVKDAKG